MNMPVIRPAIEQDIDGLVALACEFHEFHVLGVPDRLRKPDSYDEPTVRSTLRELLQRDDAQIFVVDYEGNIIGLAEVYLRQDEPNPFRVAHRYGYLQSLMVSAPFREKGLGKQLVVTAHQWAKERHATEMQVGIWEFAAGPLHFYEALGYRTLRRDMVVELD